MLFNLFCFYFFYSTVEADSSSGNQNLHTITSSGEAIDLFLSWRQLVNGNKQKMTILCLARFCEGLMHRLFTEFIPEVWGVPLPSTILSF